jgi:hypothetical protein
MLVIAIHLSSALVVEPLALNILPAVCSKPIALYLWDPFNQPEHSLCFGRDDIDFNKDDTARMTVSVPKQAETDGAPHMVVLFNLHCTGKEATILAGSSILSILGLCSPFEACSNRNLFQHFFGIEFAFNGHSYVRATSTFKFVCCFNLIKLIQYRLSHEKYPFGLDALMPVHTSAWVFDQVHSHLVFLCNLNCEVFLPNQFAAPAATIQTLVNGAVCTRLPS